MGYMTKIDNEDEEIEAELAEDNDMFCSEESEEAKSNSDSDQEDDIFGDEQPATTRTTKKESQAEVSDNSKKAGQGTVYIHDRIFSKIAEEVGLQPGRCQWILSNENSKFRVTTDYMDTIYRKEKMHEILPLIALNHSQFVNNSEVQTARGMEVLRNYNARRFQVQGQGRYRQFKEKHSSHHLKKK